LIAPTGGETGRRGCPSSLPGGWNTSACLKERGRVNNRELPLCWEEARSGPVATCERARVSESARGQGGAPAAMRGRTTLRPEPRSAECVRLSMASLGRRMRPPDSLAERERSKQQARLLRHVFAEMFHRHGGLRPRPGGLNHFHGCATEAVGAMPNTSAHPVGCRASRRLLIGQATDVAVA